jgi:hypothetical protein
MEQKLDDKILLLCCTGRSGSTTLQQILNTIPNSNICGENYGAINSLLLFYKKIKQTTFIQVPGNKNPISYEELILNNIKPAWYNSYNINEIQSYIRNIIISMFKNKDTTSIWGFKEIRYENNNIELIKEFKELFPQTKVIIHIRENIDVQSKSSWFKTNPNAKQLLNSTNKILMEFYSNNKEYCYLNTFEKLFNMENMENLYTFIECKQHFDEKKIKYILDNELKSE